MNEYQTAMKALNDAAYAALIAAKDQDAETRAALSVMAHKSDELYEAAE